MTMSPTHGFQRSQFSHLLTLGSAQRNIRLFSAASYRFSSSYLSSPQTPPTQESTAVKKAKPHRIDPRWLTDTKRRIGKCLMFGLKPAQVDEAGRILQRLARDWRELIAGTDGFLTHTTRRALFRRDVVWGDMDSMVRSRPGRLFSTRDLICARADHAYLGFRPGHINNVAYVRYAETARVNLMHNYATHIDPAHQQEWLNTVGNKGIGLILQSIKIDYKFPMTWPDKITVYHRLTQNPSDTLTKSYFQQEALILSECKQRPAARVIEQNFLYDYTQLRKTDTAPEFMLQQFQEAWALQEESKKLWQQQVADIENEVRRLELESWNNPNAVEDMGSAG
ncbi:conserved hypothetical protein [Talaromyces stipitatus ATCC 10500]|uniref:Thioesterase/thiol ester dehydrase-isomerase n=1 Tax=Talaromyces stipitatus (strain ATCC 10500 / CBS 375.48 / QM 6759 / NRRL 1006) TaxID=441959 RepID=B8LXL5_TALSN|nr:uncharacterized protein TSTA_078710 [Talaromyces stipitatus ATCC 10500]EED24516.1 conserved hypothetical protein [Talaromyces stipitatus ATCC 10500]